MTRLLFIFPAAPLAPNHSGGAARWAQHHEVLQSLGMQLHVLRVGAEGTLGPVREFEATSPFAKAAIASSASWQDVEYVPASPAKKRIDLLRRTIVDPIGFEFPDAEVIASVVAEAISRVQPDAIWVNRTDLGAAIWRLAPPIPWILFSHDLMYRVRRIRNGVQNIKDRWLLAVCRRAEREVSRRATCVVTGSATDGQRLVALGCRSVHVIPVGYGALPPLPLEVCASADMRIVHLGSLETTANRVGLETYLRKAHTDVVTACRAQGLEPKFWVIGDASRVKQSLADLLQRSNAVLKGFAPDLSSVLRPFDVAILPYEHDTGCRTKLPLLFNHAQVVVSTRSAIAGMQLEGLQEACLLVDRVEEFPSVIAALAANSAERERLGYAARAFSERHFTLAATSGHYRALLESIPISRRSGGHQDSLELALKKATDRSARQADVRE